MCTLIGSFEGNTALHYACIRNQEEVVYKLVSAGINVNAFNLNKRSAINYTDNPAIQCILLTGFADQADSYRIEIDLILYSHRLYLHLSATSLFNVVKGLLQI